MKFCRECKTRKALPQSAYCESCLIKKWNELKNKKQKNSEGISFLGRENKKL